MKNLTKKKVETRVTEKEHPITGLSLFYTQTNAEYHKKNRVI